MSEYIFTSLAPAMVALAGRNVEAADAYRNGFLNAAAAILPVAEAAEDECLRRELSRV